MSDGKTTDVELTELRDLLFGPERAELDEIRRRLQDRALRDGDVGEVLPEGVLLRAARDPELRKALQPLIEQAIRSAVRRHPQLLAETLFPIIGAAVRRAVASALQGMVESINQLVEASFSLRSFQWRLEAWRTGKSYGEIALVRSLLYRVEQVFLIQSGTGLLLQHVISERAVAKDPDMVSGMLTAIQNFVQDSFGGDTEDGMEMMRVGEVSVWVQHGPQALLAAVVRGTAPVRLGWVLSQALETIHRDYAAELGSMDGVTGGLEKARPLLAGCLLGQSAGKPASPRKRLIAIGAVVLIALAAWAVWSLLQQRKWNSYLDLLRREPGIVVTHERRDGGKFTISGLRDPLARDPAALLPPAGIPPGDVNAAWAPYLSLAPSIEATRQLRELSAAVERQQVRFEPGQVLPLPAETDNLYRIALMIQKLAATATTAGRNIRLELAGQTDPTGTAEANRNLAPRRAEEVRTRLIGMGIDSRLLVSSSAEARQQRAVSFRVWSWSASVR